MPLERCVKNGVMGWRWGSQGACYAGEAGKKKALKQGFAEDPDHFKQEMAKSSLLSEKELSAFLFEQETKFGNKFLDGAFAYVSQKERDKMPLEDFGDPENRGFPVKDEKHFKLAVRDLGREPAEKQEKIKKRLIEIARRKGYAIPSTWEEKK